MVVGFIENPHGHSHPQGRIEKDQIHPQEHEIRPVQVGIASQPLRCKRHESAIQFTGREHDHPEPGVGSLLSNAIAYPHRHRPGNENGQEFQADDGRITAAPSFVRARVFHPQPTERVIAIFGAIHAVFVA